MPPQSIKEYLSTVKRLTPKESEKASSKKIRVYKDNDENVDSSNTKLKSNNTQKSGPKVENDKDREISINENTKQFLFELGVKSRKRESLKAQTSTLENVPIVEADTSNGLSEPPPFEDEVAGPPPIEDESPPPFNDDQSPEFKSFDYEKEERLRKRLSTMIKEKPSVQLPLETPLTSKYERFLTVPLPRPYDDLLKIFNAMDKVVYFTKSKGESCIFHKIIKSIENICNKNVKLDHLAKIRTIYPEAYKLEEIKYFLDNKKILSYLIEIFYPEKSETESSAVPSKVYETPFSVMDTPLEQEQSLRRKSYFKMKLESYYKQNKTKDVECALLPSSSVETPSEAKSILNEILGLEKKAEDLITPVDASIAAVNESPKDVPERKLSIFERIKKKELESKAKEQIAASKASVNEISILNTIIDAILM